MYVPGSCDDTYVYVYTPSAKHITGGEEFDPRLKVKRCSKSSESSPSPPYVDKNAIEKIKIKDARRNNGPKCNYLILLRYVDRNMY